MRIYNLWFLSFGVRFKEILWRRFICFCLNYFSFKPWILSLWLEIWRIITILWFQSTIFHRLQTLLPLRWIKRQILNLSLHILNLIPQCLILHSLYSILRLLLRNLLQLFEPLFHINTPFISFHRQEQHLVHIRLDTSKRLKDQHLHMRDRIRNRSYIKHLHSFCQLQMKIRPVHPLTSIIQHLNQYILRVWRVIMPAENPNLSNKLIAQSNLRQVEHNLNGYFAITDPHLFGVVWKKVLDFVWVGTRVELYAGVRGQNVS